MQCGEGCGEVQLVTRVDSCFLKMFLWERFSMIAPKSMEFSIAVMEEVVFPDRSKGTRPYNSSKPRAWRWFNTKQEANQSLLKGN